MEVIVKSIFGSHLYGTDTPDSDRDYKGVFKVSLRNLILNKIPKSKKESSGNDRSKNTRDDVDIEFWSLHNFLDMACRGEIESLDLLHAPESCILEKHPIWDKIVSERSRFYTKKLDALVGYGRKQAAKYGVKGSRLAAAKAALDILNKYGNSVRISEIWPEMMHLIHNQDPEHVQLIIPADSTKPKAISICGRQIQETVSVDYAQRIVQKFYDNYGERARKAESNEGIDWKAVSHAVRAAYQMIDIYTKGTIVYPLENADVVKDIKMGNLNFMKEVSPLLDHLIDRVEELASISNYPEYADRKYWENFLINTYLGEIK